MRVDDLARDAGAGIRRATERSDVGALERLHRTRVRRRRDQRVIAGAVGIAFTVAIIIAGIRVLSWSESVPANPLPGGTILYGIENPKLGQRDWYTAHPDGTNAHALGITATCADWFPDGRHIYITNDAAAVETQLGRPAVIDADGSNLSPLEATTNRDLDLGCGDVSPDGRRLVLEGFGANKALNGIYTVSATDGGDLVRLTSGMDSAPSYSADGSQVVFLHKVFRADGPALALFVVSADGGDARRITPWGAAYLGYSWSPDGRWIVFSHPGGDLYLVHPDGSAFHRVPIDLPDGTEARSPSWSPDGRWIIFSLRHGKTAEIAAVHLDGTGLRRLLSKPGAELTTPSWTP